MKLVKITFILFLTLSIGMFKAQDLPVLSPFGKVEQKVGLTNITIEYSRPSVRGRKIFGDLLPYGEVWRVGANACTKITTDQTMKFGDQLLQPGTYAIFAFPDEERWKVVFNSDIEQWGSNNYDPKLDVVTLEVIPEDVDFTETLEIEIEDITLSSGTLAIHWEKTEVEMPFTLTTNKTAEENIKKALETEEDKSKVHYNAARYYQNLKDFDAAKKHIKESIKIKSTYKNLFQKAKILADEGKKKEAIKIGEQALELAKKEEGNDWVEYIEGTIKKWKGN